MRRISSQAKRLKGKVSIVIKALNEEDNIAMAIESSLEALKGFSGEVILADSLSTDKTVEIAKKYPVKIVQLKNASDRSCGVGPQLGYQHATGDFVYILDGDMQLRKGFLESALEEFSADDRLAGVAGGVEEMRTVNMVFKRRKEHPTKEYGFVDRLEMGGLYRREALEAVGYFSNRNLHAYEEAELGLRLVSASWKLKRIKVPAVRHYGYATSSAGAFRKRWKTGYVKGCGEYLRAALAEGFFFKVAWQLKIYLGVIGWWLGLLVLLFVFPFVIQWYLLGTLFLLFLFLLKKKSFKQVGFSLVSWHFYALGLLRGFFAARKDARGKIPSKVIKK